MSVVVQKARVGDAFIEDAAKIPAFFRRDLLILWSYRAAFVGDWVNMIVQILVFYFVGKLVSAQSLPTFGGRHPTYIEYVSVALLLTQFMALTLGRLVSAVKTEQLQGTIESLMSTPTAAATLQLGSVFYDVLYVPLRSAVFLVIMTLAFGIHFHWAGLLPMAAVFAVFMPFMWGLGVLSAAIVLTFRRGSASLGMGITLLTLASGAYFPITVLPSWLQWVMKYNPIKEAIEASRNALLGAAGWASTLPTIVRLLPMAAISLAIGMWAFRLALQRERRRGTLGLY
jgi:ABC-2 type transport system permease protein